MDNFITELKEKTVLSVKEATQILGSRSKLYRMESNGFIRKVEPSGLGFFTLPDTIDENCHFIILDRYYSKCTVSGKTALRLYELCDDYFEEIDVDIPNTTNLNTSIFNVHRVSKSQLTDIERRSFPDFGIDHDINIYSPERVLFEVLKYYGEGTESFIRAIKRYRSLYLDINRTAKQYEKILKIDKNTGEKILNVLKVGDVSE